MKKTNQETLAANDLHATLKAGSRELKKKSPKAALALDGLSLVVPRIAKHVHGWSGEPLERPFFAKSRKAVH